MPNIPGPRGAIPYERDALGYPRIRARDANDAAFARGYLHAHDRLVQIQLTLAAARGRLMQVLGDKPIARHVDRAARAFGFASDLEEQEKKLSPRTRAWLSAYADGVNAGVEERRWPLALRLLGVAREPFTVGSIVLVYRFVSFFGLTSLVETTKLLVTELAARGAPRRAFELLLGDGARGIDLESLTETKIARETSLLELPMMGGSNAFAVSKRRSSTGGALEQRRGSVPSRTKFKNVLLQGKLPAVFGFDSREVELPGGPVAPFQSRVVDFEGERIVAAPAFHLVMDMSRRGAWYHVPGGASERRPGPGYGAGVREWIEGRFFPLGDAEGPPPDLGSA